MAFLARYAPFIIPALWTIGGALAGFVLDRVVLARVQTSALFKQHYWLGIAIGAGRAGVIILCTVAGIYIAMLSSHMDPRVEESLDKVLLVLILAWATFVAAKLAGGAVAHFGRGADKQVISASLFSTIAQVAVIVMGGLIVLSSLGVAITPLLTALGVGGLAVALALKDTLSNLFSGIQIIASRQIRPGDYIKMENSFEGYVEDIHWRNTTIRETRNNLVVIPNEKLAQSVFTNYRLPESEIVTEISINVPFESDLEQVERAATTAASHAATALREAFGDRLSSSAPKVAFRAFGIDGVETVVSIRVPEHANQSQARHSLIRALHAEFRAEGIEVSQPRRDERLLLKM
ncbi:MAG: mechanosensitive ion channel family protein [Candidatus Cybelea sp.]|jgi:small-conductance mechanosensitive channel